MMIIKDVRLTLTALEPSQVVYADSVDQDQTAQIHTVCYLWKRVI